MKRFDKAIEPIYFYPFVKCYQNPLSVLVNSHFKNIRWNIGLHPFSNRDSVIICLTTVYTKKIQVTSRIFHGYTTRKCCITISYHAIENTVASKASIINAKYEQTWMLLKWFPNFHPLDSVFKPFQSFYLLWFMTKLQMIVFYLKIEAEWKRFKKLKWLFNIENLSTLPYLHYWREQHSKWELVYISANTVPRQLPDLSHEIGPTLQPAFISKKLQQDLKRKEAKSLIVNQQCVVFIL